jgi:predicted nucleic acid-binding protein
MSNFFSCVLDTSVSTKQFIIDPLTPKVNQLLDCISYPKTKIFVPDLFYIESTNVLWKYVKAGLYSISEVTRDLANLKKLALEIVSTTELMESAFLIATNYQISAYDASYVALSQKVNAPLLTLDKRLVNTLSNSPYNVINFADFVIPNLP